MTIQYIMLVSLGFLIASLITLLLAPIFWQRAVRLTSTRLRQSMPLTEQEILADKDQLRAKYAIRVHQLEKQIEQATLGGARQKIDLNRRDASITQLETAIERLKAQVEESQNARSVLEQTVSDRLPKIEVRLDEARKLLTVRDKEIADLTQSGRRQNEALSEARVINQKQSADIEQLRGQLRAYEAQSKRSGNDRDHEGELAIRTELEVLRSRSREQASLIERLNGEIAAARSATHGMMGHNAADQSEPSVHAGNDAGAARAAGRDIDSNEEIVRLQDEVATLRQRLEQAGDASRAIVEAERDAAAVDSQAVRNVVALEAKVEDQAAEIARLTAELAASVGDSGTGGAMPTLRDNRIALKARLSGLEAKSTQQADTIQRLRAELAQTNERAARQASNFLDEMRRLGVAAHVTQPRTGRPVDAAAKPRSVAKRTQALFDAARPPAPETPASANPALDKDKSGDGGGKSAVGEVTVDHDKAPKPGNGADDQAKAVDTSKPGSSAATPLPLGRRLAVAAPSTANSEPATAGEDASLPSAPTTDNPPVARIGARMAALRPPPTTNGTADGETAATLSKDATPRQPRLVDRITAVDRKA